MPVMLAPWAKWDTGTIELFVKHKGNSNYSFTVGTKENELISTLVAKTSAIIRHMLKLMGLFYGTYPIPHSNDTYSFHNFLCVLFPSLDTLK